MPFRRDVDVLAMTFGLAASLAYVLVRALDYARGQVVDPLTLVHEVRTAYYWRIATACFWGGTVALSLALVLRYAPGATPAVRTALTRILAPAVVALGLCALLWP